MRCTLLTQVRVDWSCERERPGTVISTEHLSCLQVKLVLEGNVHGGKHSCERTETRTPIKCFACPLTGYTEYTQACTE